VALAAPVIDALRSTMSRLAIAVFQVGGQQATGSIVWLARLPLLSAGLKLGAQRCTASTTAAATQPAR
jgi:hypothetical protein